jgi:hypothetical protein
LVRRAGLTLAGLASLSFALLLVLAGCGGGASQAPEEERTTNHGAGSATVELQPTNDSGVSGIATFAKADGGVRVELELRGMPRPQASYLAHIHPGACGDEDHAHHGHGGEAARDDHGEDHEHGEHEHEEHGTAHEQEHEGPTADEIEYPLTPVESDAEGRGSSTSLLEDLTLDGLLSGEHKYINVHAVGSGEPPQLSCANLNEAE